MPAAAKSTLMAFVGIAAFSGLVFGCIGGGIGGYQLRKSQEDKASAGTSSSSPSANAPTASGPKSKAEFEKLVIGKNGDQIIAAIGRPDDTRENVRTGDSYNAGMGQRFDFVADWWTYRNRVKNEATGKLYSITRIRLLGGRADMVEYQ